jgi:hypothetical protein
VTRRTQWGERATGPVARWTTWRPGLDRLLADVLGWGGSGRAALYEVLADEGFEEPWTRQELDALWAAVHARGPAAHSEHHQAVG